MGVKFRHKGSFSNTEKMLKHMGEYIQNMDLDKYGVEGVNALMSNTPVDTGLLATSWYYRIVKKQESVVIQFCNSDIENYVPVAIILQYGHATKNGGWVEGIDYINPALKPVFNKILKHAWEEVTKS